MALASGIIVFLVTKIGRGYKPEMKFSVIKYIKWKSLNIDNLILVE